jgi:hypothetical protein
MYLIVCLQKQSAMPVSTDRDSHPCSSEKKAKMCGRHILELNTVFASMTATTHIPQGLTFGEEMRPSLHMQKYQSIPSFTPDFTSSLNNDG